MPLAARAIMKKMMKMRMTRSRVWGFMRVGLLINLAKLQLEF
jgi:hypothetical protein